MDLIFSMVIKSYIVSNVRTEAHIFLSDFFFKFVFSFFGRPTVCVRYTVADCNFEQFNESMLLPPLQHTLTLVALRYANLRLTIYKCAFMLLNDLV